jgi:tRNA (cytidine/uridine-2'-O-)-methyltransferase
MLHVVLVEPEIPPNTGNIGRLCLATNSRLHLVGKLGFKIDDATLRRAGLDYWKDVDCCQWPDLAAVQALAAPEARFWYFTTRTTRSYWDAEFRDGDYLVFGRETKGLPEEVILANAATCIRIPQSNVRSVNLSTSAGIGLYEAIRQLRMQGNAAAGSLEPRLPPL